MKKALEYAETLAEEYTDLLEGKSFQKVFKEHKKDSYQLQYAGGTIKLHAMGGASPVYAIRELMIGRASGHEGDFYGSCEPKHALRPLWIGCDRVVDVDGGRVCIPGYLVDHVDVLCKRLLELGYNAFVFCRRDRAVKEGACDVVSLFETIQQYGIKVIVSVEGEIPKKLPFDYLWCEFVRNEASSKQTQYERVLSDLKGCEGKGRKVVYYVPIAGEWMCELCDEMGPETILAFPAMLEGHLHPFWKKLRQSPDVSATPLLPVVNIGSVGCGEGLWPNLNVGLMEKVFSQIERHVFAGIVGVVNQLPGREGLLDCTLWAASQWLWSRRNVRRSVESWLMGHLGSGLEYNRYFEMIDSLVGDLMILRSFRGEVSQEESRVFAESILGRLKELQVKLESEEKKRIRKEGLGLYDYYVVFERDAKRIVLQFLQKYNVAMASLLGNDDGQEAFWTQYQGTKSGRVIMLEEPNMGTGSGLKEIYRRNRLV